MKILTFGSSGLELGCTSHQGRTNPPDTWDHVSGGVRAQEQGPRTEPRSKPTIEAQPENTGATKNNDMQGLTGRKKAEKYYTLEAKER